MVLKCACAIVKMTWDWSIDLNINAKIWFYNAGSVKTTRLYVQHRFRFIWRKKFWKNNRSSDMIESCFSCSLRGRQKASSSCVWSLLRWQWQQLLFQSTHTMANPKLVPSSWKEGWHNKNDGFSHKIVGKRKKFVQSRVHIPLSMTWLRRMSSRVDHQTFHRA